MWFPVRRGILRRRVGSAKAFDDVSFTVGHGSTMALVGESGAGKTRIGRAVVRIQPVTSGTIRFKGEVLQELVGSDLRRRRREFQMIFQDPFGSLDPRQTVADILAESLAIHGLARPASGPREFASFYHSSASTRLREPIPARVQRCAAPADRGRPGDRCPAGFDRLR